MGEGRSDQGRWCRWPRPHQEPCARPSLSLHKNEKILTPRLSDLSRGDVEVARPRGPALDSGPAAAKRRRLSARPHPPRVAGSISMFAAKKIVKEKGQDPEAFELDVAQVGARSRRLARLRLHGGVAA